MLKRLVIGLVVLVIIAAIVYSAVTATTLVRTHNLLGRTYLAMVMPFHRRVVPGVMMQIERKAA